VKLSARVGEVCSEVARLDPGLGGLCEELRLAVEALELEASGLEPEEVYARLRELKASQPASGGR
jgi:hypothetical protein